MTPFSVSENSIRNVSGVGNKIIAFIITSILGIISYSIVGNVGRKLKGTCVS